LLYLCLCLCCTRFCECVHAHTCIYICAFAHPRTLIPTMHAAQAAKQINLAGVHVLLDVNGYTGEGVRQQRNILMAFTPAPLQVARDCCMRAHHECRAGLHHRHAPLYALCALLDFCVLLSQCAYMSDILTDTMTDACVTQGCCDRDCCDRDCCDRDCCDRDCCDRDCCDRDCDNMLSITIGMHQCMCMVYLIDNGHRSTSLRGFARAAPHSFSIWSQTG
jgi:hypothetical protein